MSMATNELNTGLSAPVPFVREQVQCALCGADQTRLLYTIPLQTKLLSNIWVKGERVALHETATVVACVRCGLQYVNPRYRFDDTVLPYTETMEELYFAETYAARQQSYRAFVRRLPHWLGRNVQHLLDVGCGDGVLLEAADSAGITCVGVEQSRTLQQRLQAKYQERIIISDAVEMLPANHFDVITLLNVIEHVTAPHALLALLWTKLSPGGILFVHTPNAGGLPARWQRAQWSQIEPLGHLYYFSAQTLGALLQKSGFDPIGRFHLAVSGKLKGMIQAGLGRLGIYVDNGLGIVARRKG